MRLLSVELMKELENAAVAAGFTIEKMIDNAGKQIAQVIHARYYLNGQIKLLGLVGVGNNGGDTLIALIELQKAGWDCSAIIVKPDKRTETLVDQFTSGGGKSIFLDGGSKSVVLAELKGAHVILDGIAGTGFSGPFRSPFGELLTLVGKHTDGKTIVAVDCPSGVNCDTGEVSIETLHADLTICLDAVKQGLVKFPAFEYCGEILTVELGLPTHLYKELKVVDEVIEPAGVKKLLPNRPANSHKGSFGHVLVCGGSVNYPGAPVLAGKAAYRVGSGLVQSAIPERIYEITAGAFLESIWLLLDDENGVIAESAAPTLLEKTDQPSCLLIGPGLGLEETTQKFFNRVVFNSAASESKLGMGFVPKVPGKAVVNPVKFPIIVIDADGLRILAKTADWNKKLKAQVVLTPHPGEMAALTGLTIEAVQKDRVEVAKRFAMEWGQVIVLKGALTVIAQPDGRVSVMPFANSVLAKAGAGDVLAGLVAGLAGQGVPLASAAIAGVWLHARSAALLAAEMFTDRSIHASEILELIPDAIGELS
jgi:ADP-dependent NAD(P)H-hydrate dehydratase / NAD(P)H-hydrate epimerase